MGGSTRTRRSSILGNVFHLFSVVAFFSMMTQVLGAKLPSQLTDLFEEALRSRCVHTVWEPGRLDHCHDLLSADEVVSQMRLMFPGCLVPDSTWNHTRDRLTHCDLASRLSPFGANFANLDRSVWDLSLCWELIGLVFLRGTPGPTTSSRFIEGLGSPVAFRSWKK